MTSSSSTGVLPEYRARLLETPETPDRRVAASVRANQASILSAWQRTGGRARPALEVMLELLAGHFETRASVYRCAYLDECQGMLSSPQWSGRRQEFVAQWIQDISHSLPVPAPDREAVERALTSLHAPLEQAPGSAQVRLLAFGDCLLGHVRRFLPYLSYDEGVPLALRHVYFSAAQERALSHETAARELDGFQPNLLSFSFFSYEGLPQYDILRRGDFAGGAQELEGRVTSLVGEIRRFLTELRDRTDAPFLLHNVSGLPLTALRHHNRLLSPVTSAFQVVLDRLNGEIGELAEHLPNTILVDEVGVVRSEGHRHSARPLLPRALRKKSSFHAPERFGEQIAHFYLDVVRSFATMRKSKVLLLDFDNTLWSGVMAEGPVVQNREFQRLLGQLREAGMLLAAVSKNDPANIRWDEMVLRTEDFVRQKISWNLKVQSIEELAHELDLGLDSFVFIDDSAEERALVAREFPQVPVLDPDDPFTHRCLARLQSFPNTGHTDEARNRTALYRAQAERKEALSKDYDYPAMMASLRLRILFGPAKERDLRRVEELVQRTNQFNTTTRRYTRAQLVDLFSHDSARIYVAEVVDRFSNLGLVAVVIVRWEERVAVFDSFIMSCRAMGLGVETAMIRLVLESEGEAEAYDGIFLPTDRNAPASRLYENAGFDQVSDERWTLPSGREAPAIPAWFSVEAR